MDGGHDDSLELLLDTITNAFGGILFLALLVVVLLQVTTDRAASELPSRELADKLVGMQTKLLSASRERDELLQALSVQDRLGKQLMSEENQRNLETLEKARDSNVALKSDRIQLADVLVSKQNEINSLAQSLNELKDRLKVKAGEVDDAELKLREEVRTRTTTAKLPRLHETSKVEIAAVVRFGRLYFVHRYDASMRSREVNTDHMVIIDEGPDGVVATPKPYQGIAMDQPESLRAAIDMELRMFPAGTIYLAIAVWEDSFDQFIRLKNVLVELGHEYRVIPVEEGGMVTESSVDTPLVQ